MVSSTQWERIVAIDVSRLATKTDLDNVNADHSTAKQTARERSEALMEAIAAAREQGPKCKPSAWDSILTLDADYRRAEAKFEVLDREKRRLQDAERKATERLLALIKDTREGPDLFTKKGKDAGDDEGWKGVLIADLVGEAIGGALAAVRISTVGELIDDWTGILSLVKDKKLPKDIAMYAGGKVRAYLESRALKVPKALQDVQAPKIGKLDLDAIKVKEPEEEGEGDEAPKGRKIPEYTGKRELITSEEIFPAVQITFGYLMHPTKDQHILDKCKELEDAGWGTPLLYLERAHALFKKFTDPKEAAEAIIELPGSMLHRMAQQVEKCADDPLVMMLLGELGAANIDAFLNVFGGKEGLLNKLRIVAEHGLDDKKERKRR